MQQRTLTRACVVLGLMLGTMWLGLETAVAQETAGMVVATGLNGPMGVLVTPDGYVWVIDTGVGGDADIELPDLETHELKTVRFGETARVIRIGPDTTRTTVAALPSVVMSPEESFGGGRLAMLNGTLYATSGAWMGEAERMPKMAAVVRVEEGRSTELVTTWDLENDHNPDGFLVESHPYGLAAGPDGNLWMTDAAGNTLLKLDPSTGHLEVVVVFGGVQSPLPNPNRADALESDPVPTGVTFDRDGHLYVAFLPGFPFVPGSGKVVRVTAEGDVTDYATGLTMLTDLRTGPDGHLYAVSFGQFTEQGPILNSGAVLRIREGTASEEVLGGLSFPTSIDFDAAGDAYVALNGVGPPGSGTVVRYSALAASR